jgi:hypothetical protein
MTDSNVSEIHLRECVLKNVKGVKEWSSEPPERVKAAGWVNAEDEEDLLLFLLELR